MSPARPGRSTSRRNGGGSLDSRRLRGARQPGGTAADSPWRIPLALAPLPPFLFFLWAVVAAVRSLDELGRRIHLEALAVAFSLATVLLMTLGLLQLAMTLPPDDWSYRHTWAFLPMFYFLGLALAQRRYR